MIFLAAQDQTDERLITREANTLERIEIRIKATVNGISLELKLERIFTGITLG
jgi:hypothetical protein